MIARMNRGEIVKQFCRLVALDSAALLVALPALAVDRAAVFRAAREVAQKVRYATFITRGEDGQPQARIVDALGPDEDFVVWVATNWRPVSIDFPRSRDHEDHRPARRLSISRSARSNRSRPLTP
jgi:hypothetical protein